jgi:Mg-chelatase subunit ChlD
VKTLQRACLSLVLLGVAPPGCGGEPREPPFPSFRATDILDELRGETLPPVAFETAALPLDASARTPYLAVPIGRGLVTALPCDEKWRWALDPERGFVATHAAVGAEDAQRPMHLVVVFDRSGSMALGGRIEAARLAAAAMIQTLADDTALSLVAFESDVDPPVHARGSDRAEVLRRLEALSPAGQTNTAAALRRARSDIDNERERGDRRAHVVLLTDGNPTSPAEDTVRAARELRESGATVSVIALADGSETNRVIAAEGRGRYYSTSATEALGPLMICESRFRGPVVGPVDAWIYAEPLSLRDDDGEQRSSSDASLDFLLAAQPELTGSAGLLRLEDAFWAGVLPNRSTAPGVDEQPSGGASSGRSGPDTSESARDSAGSGAPGSSQAGAGAEAPTGSSGEQASTARWGASTRTFGFGIGTRPTLETWTGWRWIGDNRHGVEVRVGRVQGVRDPVVSGQLHGLVDGMLGAEDTGGRNQVQPGAPVTVLVGFASRAAQPSMGIAMACQGQPCPVAAALGTFFAELRDGGSEQRVLTESRESVPAVAWSAGFVWLPRATEPAASESQQPSR